MGETGTKDAILDAAEQLFSSQGFASTSLRAIIREAGVNTASIHYHFGSRDGLIEAVLARRAEPVNRERLERLDRLEAEFPNARLPVDGVVRAFLGPALKVVASPGGSTLGRLMGYAIMESGAELRPLVGRIFKGVIERFIPAFVRAIPEIPPEEVMWRVHFMLGAMVFTINVPRAHERAGGGVELLHLSPEDAFERLMEFVTAGMRAPATQPTGKESP